MDTGKKFEELYNTLTLDRQKSAWSKEQTLNTRCHELAKEVKEVQEALESSDNEHIADELGDVLWDLLSLIIIAQEKRITTIDDILQSKIDKIKRRKPWLLTEENVSVTEELRRWKEIKKIEVEQGLRKA